MVFENWIILYLKYAIICVIGIFLNPTLIYYDIIKNIFRSIIFMSKRIGMIYKLEPQKSQEHYSLNRISTNDIDDLATSMLDAFRDTEDFEGETLEDLGEEIREIVESTFGIFISDASFQIRQNAEVASVILISLYEGKPLISELFTKKKYMNLGMASSLLKKSINALLRLGYEELVLYVHPKNVQAINLYKKNGFIEL